MPSPFPGMDPYLEHPQIFPILHSSMIIHLMEMIQPLLPEPYFAASNERVWLEVSERYIEPDVLVGRSTSTSGEEDTAGVILETPLQTNPVLVSVPDEEITEVFLEIFTVEDGNEQLVTVAEVLSPTNKVKGEKRDQYKRKQQELLKSNVNLIEIDLLRAGEHTTAAPRNRILQKAGEYDYHICLHRFYDRLLDFYVYPIWLANRLPEIDIPLLPQDGSIKLDIQTAFDHCYEVGPYKRRVRYLEQEPAPALSHSQESWARELLTEQLGSA